LVPDTYAVWLSGAIVIPPLAPGIGMTWTTLPT